MREPTREPFPASLSRSGVNQFCFPIHSQIKDEERFDESLVLSELFLLDPAVAIVLEGDKKTLQEKAKELHNLKRNQSRLINSNTIPPSPYPTHSSNLLFNYFSISPQSLPHSSVTSTQGQLGWLQLVTAATETGELTRLFHPIPGPTSIAFTGLLHYDAAWFQLCCL